MKNKYLLLSLALLVTSVCNSHTLTLPQCISSHMVVQRETPVPIWGWGTAGDKVVATWTINDQTLKADAIVDANGRWKLFFPQQNACANPSSMEISVSGTSLTKTLTDILVGDVWIAGGQSNMEKRFDYIPEYEDYLKVVDNFTNIRFCRTNYQAKTTEMENSKGDPWYVCDSTNLYKASAVAYVFAHELQEKLQIPIGMLTAYRGGTDLETWMSRSKLENDPDMGFIKGRLENFDNTKAGTYPTINYNGQIHPIKQFAIKGFIFYQGENNVKRAPEYRFVLGKLVEDWREQWGLGELPFYFVQLFNVGPTSNGLYEESGWADIREQQAFLSHDEQLPNTGMAVIIETNEQSKNTDETLRMHPHTKKPVGERLAWLALKNTYGLDIVAEAPAMKRHYTIQDTMYIEFDNVADGLAIRRDSDVLAGFVIADDSRTHQLVKAEAKIINDSTVALFSPEIQSPYVARYAWAKDPVCNLINSEGIPVGPFRTDCWTSGVGYSLPDNDAPANGDNSLVCIHVNGVKLANFSNSTLSYDLEADTTQLPYVTAVVRHPKSKMVVSQVKSITSEQETDRTAIITVTAENGTQRVFRLVFNHHVQSATNAALVDHQGEKIINNGVLMIQKGDRIYTATGFGYK